MQLLTVSLNAPDAHTHTHAHTFGIIFLIHQLHKRETCTGLPSSGGTSQSTSDFRTHMGPAKEMGGGGGGGGLERGGHEPRLNQAAQHLVRSDPSTGQLNRDSNT